MTYSASLKDWSATAASNWPAGTDNIGTALDDGLRALQAAVRADSAGLDTIASGATCDIGSKDAGVLSVTGTTTITSFSTVSTGIRKVLVFAGALTLTHNATTLILPTGANITTAAGDVAEFVRESGGWRCLNYLRANGNPLSVSALTFAAGSSAAPSIAFTADTDTGIFRSDANVLGFVAGGPSGAVATFDASNGLSYDVGGVAARYVRITGSTSSYAAGVKVNGSSGSASLYATNPSASTPLLTLAATGAGVDAGVNYVEITNGGGMMWRIDGTGATYADGAYSGSGADYAEAFLVADGEPMPLPGDPVALEGDRVRVAGEGDDIIGVVSEKPCAVGDARLLAQSAVAVGLMGKLRVNEGRPVDPSWRLLGNNVYLVK